MQGYGQFDQEKFWEEKNLIDNPHYRKKLEISLAFIPGDVNSILDIGCGDGSITNHLPENNYVIGFDRSLIALQKVVPSKVCGNSTSLPFKTKSFDLIFSSELLEHLKSGPLFETIREIKRISRKYILVSTPFNEFLFQKIMCCPKCNLKFHAWGHRQRFSLKRLNSLFPEYTIINWTHCGVKEFSSNYLLQIVRLYLGRKWYYEERDHAVCPCCDNKHFTKKDRTPVARFCDFLERKIKRLGRKERYPYWIVALFEKRE